MRWAEDGAVSVAECCLEGKDGGGFGVGRGRDEEGLIAQKGQWV